MKKVFLIFLCFFSIIPAYGEENFSDQTNSFITSDRISELKVKTLEDEKDILSKALEKINDDYMLILSSQKAFTESIIEQKKTITSLGIKNKKLQNDLDEISRKEYTISEQFDMLLKSMIIAIETNPFPEDLPKVILFFYYLIFCLLLTILYFIVTLPVRIILKLLDILRGGGKKSESEEKNFKLYKEELVQNNKIKKEMKDLRRQINNYKREDTKRDVEIPFGRNNISSFENVNKKSVDKEKFIVTSNDNADNSNINYHETYTPNKSFDINKTSKDDATKLDITTDRKYLNSNAFKSNGDNKIGLFEEKKDKKKKSFSLYSKSERKSSIFD